MEKISYGILAGVLGTYLLPTFLVFLIVTGISINIISRKIAEDGS